MTLHCIYRSGPNDDAKDPGTYDPDTLREALASSPHCTAPISSASTVKLYAVLQRIQRCNRVYMVGSKHMSVKGPSFEKRVVGPPTAHAWWPPGFNPDNIVTLESRPRASNRTTRAPYTAVKNKVKDPPQKTHNPRQDNHFCRNGAWACNVV